MSLLIPCPICGARDVNEFAYAGEVLRRPSQTPSLRELASYLYFEAGSLAIATPFGLGSVRSWRIGYG
jgi:sarcosine oxidase delta subunit